MKRESALPLRSLDDTALAALMAPIVLPANYIRGRYATVFGEAIYARDAAFRAEVDAYRGTPAGKHALRVYAEHRL
jgi:hypothetical protein